MATVTTLQVRRTVRKPAELSGDQRAALLDQVLDSALASNERLSAENIALHRENRQLRDARVSWPSKARRALIGMTICLGGSTITIAYLLVQLYVPSAR